VENAFESMASIPLLSPAADGKTLACWSSGQSRVGSSQPAVQRIGVQHINHRPSEHEDASGVLHKENG